jgi:hypothetical protein
MCNGVNERYMTKNVANKWKKMIHVNVYLKTVKYVGVRPLVLNYRISHLMKIVCCVINGNADAKRVLDDRFVCRRYIHGVFVSQCV